MSLRDAQAAQRSDVERRRAEGKSNFNTDKTCYIHREFLGWVGYVGGVDDAGNFRGQRVGVTASEAIADRFLAGEDVLWDIVADDYGNLRE